MTCAGVTVYKGLKMTDTRPGDWVADDVGESAALGTWPITIPERWGCMSQPWTSATKSSKLAPLTSALPSRSTARPGIRFRSSAKKTEGGARGVLVTAVSPKAFEQALGMVGRGGTIALNGLPPGSFPLPIFDMVLNGWATCAGDESWGHASIFRRR